MASRTETRVVYAAGVAQGIALVTFPAVSINAEGKSLEDVTKPLTSTTSEPVVEAGAAATTPV